MSQVYYTCAREFAEISRGRGPSHDLSHVLAVRELARELAKEEQLEPDLDLLDAMTITHDYSDHKYDKDGFLARKHQELLAKLFSKDKVELTFKAIKYASYTEERKLREAQLAERGVKIFDIKQVNWRQPSKDYLEFRDKVLLERVDWPKYLPVDFILLRDLLSDADKLEALGAADVYRCMQYGLEYWEHQGVDLSAEDLIDHVIMHTSEKLSILHPHYLCTRAAQKRAECLVKEFKQELCKLELERSSLTLNELRRRMGM